MNTAPWRVSPMTPMSETPAYTPVHARRSLERPTNTNNPASSSTTTSSNKKNNNISSNTNTGTPQSSADGGTRPKVTFPQGVRDYVSRSFVPDRQIPGVSRADMETKLKQIITQAAERNELNVIDWQSLPLPQQIIHDDQTAARSGLLAHHPKQKRKPADNRNSPPPWRRTDGGSAIDSPEKRRRLARSLGVEPDHNTLTSLERRRRRFEVAAPPQSPARVPSPLPTSSPSSPAPSGPVVGRCAQLEKNYFRLTSAPNPDAVRPVSVLRQTLELLKHKWRVEGNYTYVCDQFKSMRQDLTVQRVRTEFTTAVYEIHARIALERGDLGEYNQCQTQLRALYAARLGGHPMEFAAYGILYLLFTRNQTAITAVLAGLTRAERADPAVKHALAVRAALAQGNYHRFFRLYLTTPNMGAYLLDMFVDRERLAALCRICRAYKPDLPLRFLTEELGFESDTEAARFVLAHASDEASPSLLVQTDDGAVRFACARAAPVFERAWAAADAEAQSRR